MGSVAPVVWSVSAFGKASVIRTLWASRSTRNRHDVFATVQLQLQLRAHAVDELEHLLQQRHLVERRAFEHGRDVAAAIEHQRLDHLHADTPQQKREALLVEQKQVLGGLQLKDLAQ